MRTFRPAATAAVPTISWLYLSQIGYVAAAVGLVSGTLFLGERYQALTWIGAVAIVLGVAMTTRAQRNGG